MWWQAQLPGRYYDAGRSIQVACHKLVRNRPHGTGWDAGAVGKVHRTVELG
jgi:hypothetical protein